MCTDDLYGLSKLKTCYIVDMFVVFSVIAKDDDTYVQACDGEAVKLDALISKEWVSL